MPEPKRPLKVFLCHAHADRDAVRALYTRLTDDGVDAWLDKAKLLPGQDWELEIKKAVREADVVVVCLSKQFNQAGFRQKEVRLALDTAMEQPEGEIFIIPARLEECDNLESLRKWHVVDLFEDDGYQMLASALKAQAEKIGVTLQMKRSRKSKSTVQPQKRQGVSEKAISSGGVDIGDGVSESVIVTGHGNVINFGNSVSVPPSEKPEQDPVKTNSQVQWKPTDEPNLAQTLDLDRIVYKRLIELMPWNGSIRFIRERNFSGWGFSVDEHNGLYAFLDECKNPAFEFVDSDLEELRIGLIQKIASFLEIVGLETYPTSKVGRNAVPPEWEYERPKHFRKVVQTLEDIASQIGENYDSLVKMGRRKLGIN